MHWTYWTFFETDIQLGIGSYSSNRTRTSGVGVTPVIVQAPAGSSLSPVVTSSHLHDPGTSWTLLAEWKGSKKQWSLQRIPWRDRLDSGRVAGSAPSSQLDLLRSSKFFKLSWSFRRPEGTWRKTRRISWPGAVDTADRSRDYNVIWSLPIPRL